MKPIFEDALKAFFDSACDLLTAWEAEDPKIQTSRNNGYPFSKGDARDFADVVSDIREWGRIQAELVRDHEPSANP